MTREQEMKISAIEPKVYPTGSFDDLIYRLGVHECAEGYNSETKAEGAEYADERLPGFVKRITLRPVSVEEATAQVLKHATYLKAQANTTAFLNEMILGGVA